MTSLATRTKTDSAVPTSLQPWLSNRHGEARSLIVEVGMLSAGSLSSATDRPGGYCPSVWSRATGKAAVLQSERWRISWNRK